jgi:hypothetical protein
MGVFAMHKLAIGFFYACAALAFVVTASVFIEKASEPKLGQQYATASAVR